MTNATAATMASYLYRGLDPVEITTVNTATNATVDLTHVFLSLGLDEHLQVNGSSASDTGAVITDVQGSTVSLQTNLTTNVSYSYPPFGSLGAPSTTSPNTFRYTGREASDNTGLYYYRGRYYAPGQSRFIQEDPLGLLAGPNVYAYADNDPLNRVDPTGQFFFIITGAVGAVGGALGDVAHQLYNNGGNFGQINYSEVGTAAVFGGIAGAAAPFVATTYLGAAGLGAAVNTAQYLYSNGGNSTVGGAVFSAGIGAAGGAIGGPITNPFMFIDNISPFSGSLTAAAANSGLSSFLRNTLGDVASGFSPPANAATNSSGQCTSN